MPRFFLNAEIVQSLHRQTRPDVADAPSVEASLLNFAL